MTCREAIGGLTDLSCGDLAAGEARQAKRHLARCEPCARYWRSYRTTVDLEREAYPDRDGGSPRELPEDLVRSILAARPPSSGLSPRTWHLVHLLSGIAAADGRLLSPLKPARGTGHLTLGVDRRRDVQ